ncbi:heme NO-binding domain-containing protein [Thalassovita sp.]|uniref:heme NO-binding domain-containing protein n=1 Tax=Thalassovita sp. TaxID=1979401 RepID=UPI002B2699B9|nr:heme NO-binding domain-containing protein [Thalassovita sp.]
MHGLINRALQCFVRDTYGEDRWLDVARAAGLDPPRFESMLTYDDALFSDTLAALSRSLGKSKDDVMEDVGTYLVSHPHVEALRRLLRFGGVTFEEFLHSLDDLPERARLAVPDLDLPQLELRDCGPDRYLLVCRSRHPGFGHAMLGILRTMADDYGALVILDIERQEPGVDVISVSLVERAFAQGRSFDLGARGINADDL